MFGIKMTKNKELVKKILCWGWLLFIICIAIYKVILHMDQAIDSDSSAELILGNLLAKEGHFLFSENWYYSTGLRVFGIQAIFAILFRFILLMIFIIVLYMFRVSSSFRL